MSIFEGYPDHVPLTTVEVAKIADYDRVYIGNLCRQGHLKATNKGNRWYILPKDLREFMDTHTKYAHFEGMVHEYGNQLLGGDTVTEHEFDGQGPPTNSSALWESAERRTEGATEKDMQSWRYRGQSIGEITIKLSDAMRGIEPGESLRLTCTKEMAKRLQSYIREAAQHAGWYDSIQNHDDWKKWQFWVSHVEPCDHDKDKCYIQIARLRTAKSSRVVRSKKKKMVTRMTSEGWVEN
jgi:TusA-related sulfurtransferase